MKKGMRAQALNQFEGKYKYIISHEAIKVK